MDPEMEGADGREEPTVLLLEAALVALPVTDAFAVSTSPGFSVRPDTAHTPYPLTVAVPSEVLPALNNSMDVPIGSVELPVTILPLPCV
jgi:hypothetical protein